MIRTQNASRRSAVAGTLIFAAQGQRVYWGCDRNAAIKASRQGSEGCVYMPLNDNEALNRATDESGVETRTFGSPKRCSKDQSFAGRYMKSETALTIYRHDNLAVTEKAVG